MTDDGTRLFDELMRFKPDGLTANGWAVKAGVSRTIWSDLKRHGNPSRRTLEKLLSAAGSSLAEFEALRVGHFPPETVGGRPRIAERGHGWRNAPLAPIPLFATALAGQWGEVGGIGVHSIDRSKVVGKVDRPPALAADAEAYAVVIAGESMWPRFRSGRWLLVSPAASIGVGDDVLVLLADDQGLIKELVRRSAGSVELRQFSPNVTFVVNTDEIAAIHKIVGEAI
jgi:SOS-response transcriptional repressor LexA